MFDLIIIGGGVNGAGVARDASGRGAKVLLLEAGDLASGTSSKSSKLAHGGLRYLEHYEFALVREALAERENLWNIAPHIVAPMRIVLPVTKGMRPAWMLRVGLFLYDNIGGRGAFPTTSSLDLSKHEAGKFLKEESRKSGFEYSDCWVDDARLVVLNAKAAKQAGAEIRLHERVVKASREGGANGNEYWLVETEKGQYRARGLVNAGGPGVDLVAEITGRTPEYGIRRVRGSHIVVDRQFDHDAGYILQLTDRRICFVLPFEQDFTLIGTTDADHAGRLDEVEPSEEEIAYLLSAFAEHFEKPLVREDVRHAFAGVRALIDEGEGKPEAATRGYRLTLSEREEGAPVLGIYGGKITSYRHVSEEATDMLAGRMEGISQAGWSAKVALPGGDFPRDGQDVMVSVLCQSYPFLDEKEALRLVRAYGVDAKEWLGSAKTRVDLGRDFGAGLSEAEVEYLRSEEWANCAEDIVWRRSKLGLKMSDEQQEALAHYLA